MNKKELPKETEGDKDASTFLSLEHYMYPVGMDEDPIENHLLKAKKIMDINEDKILGFSRFYDIKQKVYDWKGCELLEFYPSEK